MTMITDPNDILAFHRSAQYKALKMEVETGMRFSNRGNIGQTIRNQTGLSVRSKSALLKAFRSYIIEETGRDPETGELV